MKKIFTLFLLTLTISAFAQRNSGFKIGYNVGWVSSTQGSVNANYENYYNNSPLVAMHFGYSWNIKIVDKYSIQTDILFDPKGYRYKLTDEFYTNNPSYLEYYSSKPYDVKQEYFSLPITLNYMITPHWFVELGGEYSFSESSNGTLLHEFSFVSGFGFSTKYADISLRYIHGLTSIEKTYYPPSNSNYGNNYLPTAEYSEKNRSLQISLTIPVFKYLKKAMHRE